MKDVTLQLKSYERSMEEELQIIFYRRGLSKVFGKIRLPIFFIAGDSRECFY